MSHKFYSLEIKDRKASLSIYGDITSWPWLESDVSAYNLTRELNELDVDYLDVYINSYGGEVAEGLAIYNSLKRHKAEVTTYVDGFACSIASVIAMAGDKRKMFKSSLLMIHNAWTSCRGNATDMRKAADDLDKIMTASIEAYMSVVNIEEAELKELLDNETFLTADEALEKGFITEIADDNVSNKHSQSARTAIMQRFTRTKNEDEHNVAASFEKLTAKMDLALGKLAGIKGEMSAVKPKIETDAKPNAFERFLKQI